MVPLGGRGLLHLEGLDSWTTEQQQSAKKLLVESANVFFSKNDLHLGKCNILKHAIKITDPQPFKERLKDTTSPVRGGEESPSRDG